MIQGTYYKEWSRMLGRDMEFKVYGHAGTPVLALPARGGRFYDWENNGMPDAIAALLNEGKMCSCSAPTASMPSLLAGDTAPRRAEMQEKYFNYLTRAGSPHPDPERCQKDNSALGGGRGHRCLSGRPGSFRRGHCCRRHLCGAELCRRG